MKRRALGVALAAFGVFLQPQATGANTGANAPADAAGDERIRVQLTARNQTVLSSELSAKIDSLAVREGDPFRAGQTLVTFDCSLFRAQLNKAEASAEAARQTLKVNQRLAELNSVGSLEVDQAAARMKETEAEAGAMRATVAKCVLTAPFSGRVAKLHAEPHQFVAPGKPLLEILDTRRLELQMIVPSRWLAWLKVGSRFKVRVEELDREYAGRVTRLGARIDPVSQSIALAGEVGERPELLPGMSGWATFSSQK
jgi:RND family efflux transporter MFP subunit